MSTTLETLSDDIELMRDAGHTHINVPIPLAEYFLTCAFFIRAHQGQPLPPINAKRSPTNVVRIQDIAAAGSPSARGSD